MDKRILLMLPLWLIPIFLPAQEFCREILNQAWDAFYKPESQRDLREVLKIMQDAENCDYEDALLEGEWGRQALQDSIFYAIDRQKGEAENARDVANRERNRANRLRDEALQKAREAKSAALAARAQERLGEDPTIAFNLAVAAYDTAQTPQAGGALAAVLRNTSNVFYSFRKQLPVRNYLPNFEEIIDKVTEDINEMDIPLSFVSPDGSLMVLPAKDDTTWVLDVETNKPLFFLEELYIKPGEVLFSPDASLLLTCEVDQQSCKLWDLQKDRMGKLLQSWEDVEAAAFSPGSSKLALLTGETIKIWDKESGGVEARTLEGETWNIEKMAVSDDGKRMLTYDGDRDSLFVWNWPEGDTLAAYAGNAPHALSFSSDGRKLLAVSDSAIHILDAAKTDTLQILRRVLPERTAEEERQLVMMDAEGEPGFDPTVLSGQFSPDGSKVLTLAKRMMFSYEVKIWDAATGKILNELNGLKGMTYSAVFSPDGTRVITNSGMFVITDEEYIPYLEPEVVVWDLQRWNLPLFEVEDPPRKIQELVFFPDGKKFITLPTDEAPRVWNTQTGEEQLPGRRMPSSTHLQRVSADTLWEIRSDGRLSGRPLQGRSVSYTAVSSDGSVVAGVTTGGDLYLWKTSSPEAPYRHIKASRTYINVVITSDDRKVITGDDYGRIRVWDIRDGRELAAWQAHPESIGYLSFDISPDGKRLATATDEGVVILWDIMSQRELERWSPLDNSFDMTTYFPALKGTPFNKGRVEKMQVEVSCVRFSNDGTRLLIAAEDDDNYPVKIWDIPTKTLLFSLDGHNEPVSQAVFSPDDTHILTLDDGNNVFLWMNPFASFRNGRYHHLSDAKLAEKGLE